MSYTPTGPIARTLQLLAQVTSNMAAGQAFLRVPTPSQALGRIMPGDGGFLQGRAGAWDGSYIACAPPAIILEAEPPEYEQVSAMTWRVTNRIAMHLIHDLVQTDTPRDAYLRAWDEHSAIQAALRAAVPTQIILNGVLTGEVPVVFGPQAPAALQKHYLSTIIVSYEKGQP